MCAGWMGRELRLLASHARVRLAKHRVPAHLFAAIPKGKGFLVLFFFFPLSRNDLGPTSEAASGICASYLRLASLPPPLPAALPAPCGSAAGASMPWSTCLVSNHAPRREPARGGWRDGRMFARGRALQSNRVCVRVRAQPYSTLGMGP